MKVANADFRRSRLEPHKPAIADEALMSAGAPSPVPLTYKTARSATAALAGYRAQVWRSVLAWINLQDDELLFLEYAEDIDILRELSAVTCQVKHVRKPISLRSPDVVDAISNAWFTRTRNTDRIITYRFLTTSRIARETGDPFEAKTPGLKLWQRVQLSTDPKERLCFAEAFGRFLLKDKRLSPDLRAFLATAAPQDILTQIVDRMIWDTEAGDVASVIAEITERLIGIGEGMNVIPALSTEIKHALFSLVFEKATAPDPRRLSRPELLEIFQRLTYRPVPAHLFDKLVARHLDETRPLRALSLPGSKADGTSHATKPDESPATESPSSRGERLAVIIGNSLDDEQAISKAFYFEQMRTWRNENFTREGDPKGFRQREQDQAMALLNGAGGQISATYQALVDLAPATIISLHPDPVLERAFPLYRKRTTDSDLITFDVGTGFKDLYLLAGSAILGSGLITDDDSNLTIATRLDVLGLGFRDKLALCDIVIVGMDETQFASRRVLRSILDHRTERDGKMLFVDSVVSTEFLSAWRAERLDVPPNAAFHLLRTAPRRINMPVEPKTPPPVSPFKYLGYYSAEDAAIFQGRGDDAERIVREIKASAGRIVILTGRSGTGKTSIVNALVAPHIEAEHNTLVVSARCGDVPEASIIDACAAKLGKSVSAELLAPQHFEASLTALLKNDKRNCLIVIDQAEEAFVKLGDEVMQRFFANIEAVLRARAAPVRFMFIIRSDYLKDLFAINTPTFPILGAPVQLDDMDWDQARAVMIEPLRLFGKSIEQGLIDAILADLDPEKILPAHLSIVCDRLFREIGESNNLTLGAFRERGLSTQAILIDHLGRSLESVAVGDRPNVEMLLEALVTGDGTKGLLKLDELVLSTGLDESYVSSQLQTLIHDCRVVREVVGESTRYELSHEILAAELHARIDRVRAQTREVQDILGREVAASHLRFERLIPPERLMLVDKMRHSLHLSEDALTLIVASAAQEGQVPQHWRSAAASLPPAKLVEAVLIRPVAANCINMGEVLRRSGDLLKLAQFEFMALSPEARVVLENSLEQQSIVTLSEFAKYVASFEGSQLCVTVLNKLLTSGTISNIGGWDGAQRELLVKAANSLTSCVLPEQNLLDALLSARRIVSRIPEGDLLAPRLKPLEAWIMKSLRGHETRGEWLADKVMKELSGPRLSPLDLSILAHGCSLDRLSGFLASLPACYADLARLLYARDAEETIRASFSGLHEMDLETASAFTGFAWHFIKEEGKLREFLALAAKVQLSPRLIFLLFTILARADPTDQTETAAALRDLLRQRLMELSTWAIAQFPDYGRSTGRLLPTTLEDDLRAYSLIDWKVFAAYALFADIEDARAPLASEDLWKGVCRLCLMAGEFGVAVAGESLELFLARNNDADDRVLMLATLTAQADIHDSAPNARLRDLILNQLFEHGAPLGETSQACLGEIVIGGASPAYRVGALLVLRRWSPGAVTAKASERALEANKCPLSPFQVALVIGIVDDFSSTWPDGVVLSLFTSSHWLATRMAGRCLLPGIGTFRQRPRLLKSALMSVRARSPEFRQKWLDAAQGDRGEGIPNTFKALVLSVRTPTRAELTVLERLFP
jgi:hypothetical protein